MKVFPFGTVGPFRSKTYLNNGYTVCGAIKIMQLSGELEVVYLALDKEGF